MTARRLLRILAALSTALLLAFSQTRPLLWALAAVALVPWLVTARSASRLEAACLGALVGTLSASLVVNWIPDSLRALGSSPESALASLFLTTAWAKAPLFAATGLLWRELGRFPVGSPLVLGAFFGFGEAWISSSAWGVPGVLVGHSQLPATGVAQLALVGGVPLISAWLVALNAAIAQVVSGERRAVPVAAGLVIGWLAAAGFGASAAVAARPPAIESRGATLLVIQPDLPRHSRWTAAAQPWVLDQVASQTAKELRAEGPVDAIVWPENLLTTPIDVDEDLARALEAHVDRWQTPLLTGLVRRASQDGRTYRSSVIWIEPGRGLTAAIDKARAVPLVEASRDLPGARLLASAFGRATAGPKVAQAAAAEPLAGPIPLVPLLCYEVLFPAIAAQRNQPGSLAIVNLADDSWVHGDSATKQLTSWAAFRAIEQRLTLVRVAHGGLSAVIDEYGRTVTNLPLNEVGHLRVTLSASAAPSRIEKCMVASVALVPAVVVWCSLLVLNRGGVEDAAPNALADRWRGLLLRIRRRQRG